MFRAEKSFDIENFLIEHPAQCYSIRDKVKSINSNRTHKASRDEILTYIICTEGVSQYKYIENQILTGNILVDSKGNVTIEGTDEKCDSAREVVNNAKCRINTDIFDRKLKYVHWCI